MVAEEAFPHTPSNTSNTLEVLSQMSHIHTLPKTEPAFSENLLQLDTWDTEATTSPRVIRLNLLKDFTLLDLLLSHSRLFLASRTTRPEFTTSTTAERAPKTSTTLFWPLDTELKMALLSGTSRTPGEPLGETTDTSKSQGETTCAPSPNATPTLSLTNANLRASNLPLDRSEPVE